jgi:uncharacterized protein with HEPN domain
MRNEIKTWLLDIQQSIHEINSFLPEKKIYNEFQKDLKTQRAVERNIEIIGEAVKRILTLEPSFPISNARKIVDTRNRITHGYDSVSEDVIWAIVIRELPLLEKEVHTLLQI